VPALERRGLPCNDLAVPSLQPMLASNGAIAVPASDWAFGPTLDGWRVVVYVDH
jgi:hypothetical protein